MNLEKQESSEVIVKSKVKKHIQPVANAHHNLRKENTEGLHLGMP
jgi:hypothetical protein